MKKMTLLLLILFSFTSFGFGQFAGDLVITEFMANPAILGDAEGEYLELYNHTNSSIDLQGWTLKDDGTNSLVISGSCVVPANGVATLAISAAPGFTPTYD
jgi:hypothetical protein